MDNGINMSTKSARQAAERAEKIARDTKEPLLAAERALSDGINALALAIELMQ